MRKFTKEVAKSIIRNEIDSKELILKYPEFSDIVMKDFSEIKKENDLDDVKMLIDKYKYKARFAMNRIHTSGENDMTVNSFLPDIIIARIALNILENLNLSVQTGKYSGTIRFNLWDGKILQKILFKRDFERKPVSLFMFKLFWPFITNKKILMPLVNQKGIYCFYSKNLLKELSNIITNSKCLEIGSGDGTLTSSLRSCGVCCNATDDFSWESYIKYPDFVEKLDAKEALNKYNPEVVICSWAPPGNTFEKNIFKMESVKLYIVIGTQNPAFSGNHDAYQNQKEFYMENNQRLSALLLPPSKDNAVFIFRRK